MAHEDLPSIPVILIRTGTRNVTAVRESSSVDGSDGWIHLATDIAEAVGPALSLISGKPGSGNLSTRVFEMRRDDLQHWDAFKRIRSEGGYAYGSMLDTRGKFVKNVSFREVQPQAALSPPPIDPVAIATAAAIAQMQAQIEQLAALVEDVGANVECLVKHLQLVQQSELLAALETIRDCHLELSRGEEKHPGNIDWSRLAGLEQVLKKQHRQIIGELLQISADLRFTSVAEAKQAARLSPDRVSDLLTLEYHLLQGLTEWNELMLRAKQGAEELSLGSIDAANERVAGYISDATAASEAIVSVDSVPRGRGAISRLKKDGLFVGSRNDNKVISSAVAVRSEMREITRSAPALPQSMIGVISVEGADQPVRDAEPKA